MRHDVGENSSEFEALCCGISSFNSAYFLLFASFTPISSFYSLLDAEFLLLLPRIHLNDGLALIYNLNLPLNQP